jgi:LPXTG-site transpeptidase (sortase) family protein
LKNKIIITIVVISIISLICGITIFFLNKKETKSEDYDDISNKLENIQNTDNIEETEFMELWDTNVIGTLEISSINLKLSIADGIEDDVIAKYIGHFPSTALINGNVGLAGHNTQDFFANLKKVKKGDEIVYNFLLGTKTYIVDTIVEIQEDDWSYLEDTEDNKITLITCIKNQPTKRLCIQATEKIQ